MFKTETVYDGAAGNALKCSWILTDVKNATQLWVSTMATTSLQFLFRMVKMSRNKSLLLKHLRRRSLKNSHLLLFLQTQSCQVNLQNPTYLLCTQNPINGKNSNSCRRCCNLNNNLLQFKRRKTPINGNVKYARTKILLKTGMIPSTVIARCARQRTIALVIWLRSIYKSKTKTDQVKTPLAIRKSSSLKPGLPWKVTKHNNLKIALR